MAHTPAGAGSPAAEAEQADLLAEAEAFGAELALFDDADVPPPRRGPGRPPGSPNRATLQLKRLLLAKGYRDPAEFLAAVVSSRVEDLATGTSAKERMAAAQLRVRAAEALMPYFHQKMPIAVEHSGQAQRPVIIINDGPTATAMRDAANGAMSAHEVVEHQALSADAPAASDDAGKASDG